MAKKNAEKSKQDSKAKPLGGATAKQFQHPYPTPPSIADAINAAKTTGPADNPEYADKAARLFMARHKKSFERLAVHIEKYAATGQGDELIMLDSALLMLCARIRDHLAISGVEINSNN